MQPTPCVKNGAGHFWDDDKLGNRGQIYVIALLSSDQVPFRVDVHVFHLIQLILTVCGFSIAAFGALQLSYAELGSMCPAISAILWRSWGPDSPHFLPVWGSICARTPTFSITLLYMACNP